MSRSMSSSSPFVEGLYILKVEGLRFKLAMLEAEPIVAAALLKPSRDPPSFARRRSGSAESRLCPPDPI